MALNSGPPPKAVPEGFCVHQFVPDMNKSLHGRCILYLWELNKDNEELKGWYFAKIHSMVDRPPANFILKYNKDVTGTRKLDGFVPTSLHVAGEQGKLWFACVTRSLTHSHFTMWFACVLCV